MILYRRIAALALGFAVASASAAAPTADSHDLPATMKMTGLAPAKLVRDLCLLRYRITTSSPECQAFFDQGLGYFYSYVWMEAARSFETALQYDPECPMAWWGLSRALEQWGRPNQAEALGKANKLRERASHREQQLISARVQEKQQDPRAGEGDACKRKAIATIDNLIALYDDDEEAWYFRAHLTGAAGGEGGQTSSVPFYKALLRINPLHPGANHELVHYYENSRRPALGWVYAENYLKSSPGIPHAFHMQSHLATRIGKWTKTSDRCMHGVEVERAYHKERKVAPADDHQYSHHLETLLRCLIHDGRFAEARAIETEQRTIGYKDWQSWFQLHLAERDWVETERVIDRFRRENPNDKTTIAYLSSLLYLNKNEPARALPEIRVLQDDHRIRPSDAVLQYRLWETRGWYLCQTGDTEEGLKLLANAVTKTKDDYDHHAWGHGAYYMETWGIAALQAGRKAVAEEAFLEALAHDPCSVRAALGMKVLCESQGRGEEARRFADLSRRCWNRAQPASLAAELAALRFAHDRVGTNAK